MTFWEVFWTANELLWPVYAGLIGLYLVSIALIRAFDRTPDEEAS